MSSWFGGGDKQVDAPTTATEAEAKKAKTNRSALLVNAGGIQGEEVGQTKKRDTIFGN